LSTPAWKYSSWQCKSLLWWMHSMAMPVSGDCMTICWLVYEACEACRNSLVSASSWSDSSGLTASCYLFLSMLFCHHKTN
jgi:hypothetical protein